MPASNSPSTRAGWLFDVTYFRANLHRQDQRLLLRVPFIGNFTADQPARREHARGRGDLRALQARQQPDAQRRLHLHRCPRPQRAARAAPSAAFGARRHRLRVRRRARHGDARRRLQRAHGRHSPSSCRSSSRRSAWSCGDYWLVNAAASYKLQPGVEVFGRVENLLDQHYQEVFGFESAPIAAYAGVKLTFGGPDGIGGSRARRNRRGASTAQQRTTDACDGRHRSRSLLLLAVIAAARAGTCACPRPSPRMPGACPGQRASSRSTCAPTSSSSSWWSAAASPP